MLLHAIDASEGDADDRWRTIDAELAAYGAGLDERQQIVVLNKTDLSPDPPRVRDRGRAHHPRLPRVSRRRAPASRSCGARSSSSCRRRRSCRALDQTELVDFLVYRPEPARRAFRVFRTETRLPRHRDAARARAARGDPPRGRRARGRRGADRRRDARVADVGLYGGAFDPPHNGHVAVAQAAKEHFGLPRSSCSSPRRPGHKGMTPACGDPARAGAGRVSATTTCASIRIRARSTCCAASSFDDPLFVIGADQFCDFLAWKEPDAVLDLTRLAVATRPGYPQEPLDAVLGAARAPGARRLLRARAESRSVPGRAGPRGRRRAARRARPAGRRSADRGAGPLSRRLTSAAVATLASTSAEGH